jgi:hypothetical protein
VLTHINTCQPAPCCAAAHQRPALLASSYFDEVRWRQRSPASSPHITHAPFDCEARSEPQLVSAFWP